LFQYVSILQWANDLDDLVAPWLRKPMETSNVGTEGDLRLQSSRPWRWPSILSSPIL
jgi:hypothetical protein